MAPTAATTAVLVLREREVRGLDERERAGQRQYGRGLAHQSRDAQHRYPVL